MRLSELLYAIGKIAEDKGLSTPYIVGGLPRDRLLNKLSEINDVDITTGDAGVHALSKEISNRLEGEASYKVMPDGHATIKIGDISIDFSSNFKVPGITSMLQSSGIENPTEMQKELYSRDFTCNAALMSMDMKTVTDPTGLALRDIKRKVISTCLSPEITFGYDNRRIIRAVYLSAKLNFDIDDEIIGWVGDRPELVANASNKYLTKKLNQAVEYNKDRTVQALSKMNLWPHVPPIKDLVPYMTGM